VRRQLGIGLDEIELRKLIVTELGLPRLAASAVRTFATTRTRPPDGRFYLVHFTTPEPEALTRFGCAWHLQSPEGWTVISQNDGDTFTLHAPLEIGADADKIDPREFVYERVGQRFAMDVLVANAWAPRLTVADSFGRGRVWMAGDATHQVTPTGGYGMNTGVGDAVGLGWALAAQPRGWGAPGRRACSCRTAGRSSTSSVAGSRCCGSPTATCPRCSTRRRSATFRSRSSTSATLTPARSTSATSSSFARTSTSPGAATPHPRIPCTSSTASAAPTPDEDDTMSPEQVVRDFYAAYARRDIDEMMSH